MTMSRFDEAAWDAAGTRNLPTLPELIALSDGKPVEALVFETVITDGSNPLDVLTDGETRSVGHRHIRRVTHVDGDFVLCAEPTSHDDIYHLVGSIPSSDKRWQKIARRITGSSPKLNPCFLNHDDFADLGTSLSEFGDVEVRAMSARHRHHVKSINTTWPRLENHLRPDHHAAIQEAEEADTSVRSLRLHVEGVLDVHLRRMSGATFYGGDFNVFAATILPRLAEAAARRRNLMQGRERKIAQAPSEPIQIVLPVDVFRNASDTGRILTELSKTGHLSHAVLHRNPYLHVTVTDHHDGSNFDLMVTEPNAIDIRPGFRASPGALNGLVQHLSERFAAENIQERPVAEPVSLYSLIAQ